MARLNNKNGVTLVELLVVVAVVSVLSAAMFPLISSTYESWRTADRRIESLRVGRTAMDKITREIRKSYDLVDTSSALYIDFYPDWATTTAYRINYDNAADMEFEFGTATPVFVRDSLAAPIDSFTYTTYTRRLENLTSFRQVNAFKFKFAVSDERRILPNQTDTNLNPMTFFSQAQLRTSREGYFFARTNGYATDTYTYTRSSNDNICIKVYCDRVKPGVAAVNITVATVQLALIAGGFSVTYNLNYIAAGDYFEQCPVASTLFMQPDVRITMRIRDNTGETCDFQDVIRVNP